MELFTSAVSSDRFNPIFSLLLKPEYEAERRELSRWAEGFEDRDGKFVIEFQTTFESSFWELYLNAVFRKLGHEVDYRYHAPDFVLKSIPLCVEATIASRAATQEDTPVENLMDDLVEFNARASIRIMNSLSAKLKKYQKSYSVLPHVADRAYAIALASFDSGRSFLLSNRAIMSALYGVYFDEEASIASGNVRGPMPQFPVFGAIKDNGSSVPMGFFQDEGNADVSAVIYSPVATWGKLRVLAKSNANFTFATTLHPQAGTVVPLVRRVRLSEYNEDLLDGLHVFINPYAKRPMPPEMFRGTRAALYIPKDDNIEIVAPDDFLLSRFLNSLITRSSS